MGDTFFPQEPAPWNGDQFVNTIHPGGAGDIFHDILTDFNRDTLWDILNEYDQDTLWDILNEFDQDTLWDILNDYAQATLWDILNEFSRTTAWHIFPERIEYIAKFCLGAVAYEFELHGISTGFKIEELRSTFEAFGSVPDDFTLASYDDRVMTLKVITSSFKLCTVPSTFTITRVINDQYDEPVYPSV